MRARRLAALLAAGSMLVAGCGGEAEDAATEQDDVLSFQYGIPSGTYLPLYVADDLGYFEDAGLDPEFVNFQTGAPLLAALKSGSLDVVTTGLASVFALGQGIPLTYIVWEGDAAAGEGIVAREGSGIETLEDLGRAASIGAPTGTCAQISLYHAAQEAGLDYGALSIQNIAPNLYANAFSSDSLDAGVSWSPFIIDLEQRGHTIVGWDEEWVPGGGACPEMVIARPAFIEEHPDLPQRLLEVHDRALQAIQEDPQLAYDSLAKRLSLSPEVAKGAADRYLADYPTLEKQLDPASRYALVGEEGLVAQLTLASETFAELGVIPAPVAQEVIREAVDPSHLEEYMKNRDEAGDQ